MDTKICCLVLVHKNIQQVCRLCRQMNHPQITVFVHLDNKMVLGVEDEEMLSHAGNNIKILPERYSCYLDDWSLVEATLALLKYAKEYMHKEEKVYYALLSGQDYFIKPIQQFVDFLNDNYPQPYIDCTPYNVSNWVYPKFNHTKLSVYARRLNRKLKVRGFLFMASWLEHYLPRLFFVDFKLQRYHVPLFGGSAWWVLPDVSIEEIFEFLIKNKEFIKEYQKSITPEETFFQTMLMSSSLSHLVKLNASNDISQHCLTYANFSTKEQCFVGHPHCIVKENYESLIERPQFIARKFDLNVDAEIFDLLDNYIKDESINHNSKL